MPLKGDLTRYRQKAEIPYPDEKKVVSKKKEGPKFKTTTKQRSSMTQGYQNRKY